MIAIEEVVGQPATPQRWDIVVLSLAITVLAFDNVWWPGRALASSVCILILLAPRVADWSTTWAIIGAALTVAYIGDWASTDNHDLLIITTVLLAALTTRDPDRAELFGRGARYLIATAFTLAIVAKFASADFRSGEFGELWPATDGRLADLAERVGALDSTDRALNEEAFELLVTQERAKFAPVAGWFATCFTWWTIIIELVIAACFTLPRKSRLAIVGDLALLVFLATTYTVVPVLGFAAILGTLGLAQSRHTWISALFVVGLVGLPLQDAVARLI